MNWILKISTVLAVVVVMLSIIFMGYSIAEYKSTKKANVYQDDDFMEMSSAKIFIAPFPTDKNKFQIIIPSNDGTINVNVFAVKEDLLNLKKDIEKNIKE